MNSKFSQHLIRFVLQFQSEGDPKIYSTTLCDAIKENDNELVMTLLEKANVSTVLDHQKRTLLHLAAAYGNTTITEYLLKIGCTVDAMDSGGNTPLMIAVSFDHPEVVSRLVAAGADLSMTNEHGRSALGYAKIWNNPDIFSIIRSEIAAKRIQNATAMDQLLNAEWHRLHFPLDTEVPVPADNWKSCPLIKAFFLNDIHQVRLSLMYRADPLKQDGLNGTALHAAARNFDPGRGLDLIELLLNLYPSVDVRDYRGLTPLHVASGSSNFEFMKLLLKRGADVNAVDAYGRTPIYVEGGGRKKKVIELLLKYGADVNIMHTRQPTLLDYIDEPYVNVDVMEYFLKHLAILEARRLPVDDRYLTFIRDHKMSQYYKTCKEQLKIMKNTRVLGAITFFNLLIDKKNKIADYARNKRLVEAYITN